jgi:hypothetical protein
MSTVKEIEDAIRALSKEERARLADDLPEILPELNGDAEWRRIIDDPRPRPLLNALLDDLDAQIKANPNAFPEIGDADFERNA